MVYEKNEYPTVLRIQEDDYGCEERPEGQSPTVLVTLEDENGDEFVLRQLDSWLYEQGIAEGDRVFEAEGRLYKFKGRERQ